MTGNLSDAPAPAPPPPPPAPPGSVWKRVRSVAQFVVALAGTTAFLAYLLFAPAAPPPEPAANPRPAADVVEVVGPGLIRVQPGSPLDSKIQVGAARRQTITDAVITVTGRVAASLRPGNGKGNDFWQFDSPEVLTAYTDWQKGQADITFAEAQLASAKQLAAARLDAQKQVVARLEKLVTAGTDTAKDLAAERANLIQAEITGRKEVHEAETAVRTAHRSEAAAAKQLQQAGLAPELLRSTSADVDIVLADVPEARLNRVQVGQGCQAAFFGIPNERFGGKVTSIAPVLSKERRSLRVLFVIHDPNDKLRPGMFAEIGLGTDPRDALLVPADGVLHIGRSDYVLAGAEANTWRVVEVQIGEPHNGDVEILDGLKDGERLVGKGAILFKPLVVRALQPPTGKEGGR
ncbi:Efflux transporter, RND family, MFP subunit OS=Isosphaera pallida (strain ATCC 43644 / DSM 9630 / IS1B) GN=Isop_0340 PE=4 SV=1: HlyD_2 [Gemmata massiliana]|uniref:CusB-like beta-barrel domain-containing protein n=1 Tax=Gemmata massiliana TaxID=1210884 RepID=A0A6P2DIN4_9BACT|nr:efflux RND transporter periplasmic adaptor subunit [Gemmata massiliana]VTS01813.1 Efflux transporter, RND family, MFP subunit OS=Isosphaera pallida (strain ATCC 43644 / DSM 9630 / IS1B) GN=Isop_0340 PE=4 SV=1: HlyD_2 [Gemmata massiliana]